MKKIPTPQCNKLNASHAERVAITDFLDWLSGQGILLGEYVAKPAGRPFGPSETFTPITETDETLIMRYLEIDTKALEAERRALLDAINEARS